MNDLGKRQLTAQKLIGSWLKRKDATMKEDMIKQGYSPEEEYFYRKNQEALRKLKTPQRPSDDLGKAKDGELEQKGNVPPEKRKTA